MKKNNLLKLLGIAFVVAIVSTGIFYGLFVNRLSSSNGGKSLVVAAKDLKPGTVLQATDVKLIPWHAEDLPKGGYANAGEVVGQTVFDAITQEEPVLETRLASGRSGATSVPSGMRGVSVHVTDSTGVLALLRAGQKVDVQVLVSRPSKPEETSVKTAIEDLTVLSVNPQYEITSQGGQTLPVVTLLAKPSDADILALGDSGARVRLTLRNPADDDTSSRNSLSLGTMMHSKGGEHSTSGHTSSGHSPKTTAASSGDKP